MDLSKIIGSLIVAAIVALVAVVWNISLNVSELRQTATYNRALLCAVAKKLDIVAGNCS